MITLTAILVMLGIGWLLRQLWKLAVRSVQAIKPVAPTLPAKS